VYDGLMSAFRLGVLAVAVIGLVSRAAAQAPTPAPSPTPIPLVAGDTVPAFDAQALDGTVKHVAYPKGAQTVVMFFLSSCPTCHKMIPLWNTAFGRKPAALQVYGVMLDQESPDFFMLTPISFPVLRAPQVPSERKALSAGFKIQHVPMTVRIGAGGKVEDAAVGLLDPIRLGEFFRP
jgi:hypothetical protein